MTKKTQPARGNRISRQEQSFTCHVLYQGATTDTPGKKGQAHHEQCRLNQQKKIPLTTSQTGQSQRDGQKHLPQKNWQSKGKPSRISHRDKKKAQATKVVSTKQKIKAKQPHKKQKLTHIHKNQMSLDRPTWETI